MLRLRGAQETKSGVDFDKGWQFYFTPVPIRGRLHTSLAKDNRGQDLCRVRKSIHKFLFSQSQMINKNIAVFTMLSRTMTRLNPCDVFQHSRTSGSIGLTN